MKLFVTGGTGFIGSHFIKQALSAGYDIVALRRPGAALKIKLEKEPAWVDGNLDGDWHRILKECNALVHFAAAGVIPHKANWLECYQANVMDSLQLWIRAADAGVRRFVLAGSCFEYGKSGELFDRIPASAPLLPTGPYHASKASASLAAIGFCSQKNVEVQLLRPFHVFGEGESEERFWPSLRKAAIAGKDFPMTSGEQVRDFVPVEDVARQFLEACSEPLVPGDPHIRNIGSGNPQTLRQFAEYWWKHWEASGKLKFGELPYRVGEVMRYVPKI